MISKVISWKFNDQPGMMCKEIDGVLKIVKFPGGIPSQADQDLWTAEYEAYIASEQYLDDEAEKGMTSDSVLLLIAKALHNHENRIRALEGKGPVTLKQVISAIRKL